MKSLLSLGAAVAIAMAFIVVGSTGLPAVVATHFGAGGAANGYMSKDGYIAFMLVLVVVMPMLVVLGARLVGWLPSRLVNLPNKHYWLAPERRSQTIAWVESRTTLYAYALIVFLCFCHWLVVEANATVPAQLAERPFFIGLLAFILLTLFWAAAFYVRFRRRR